MIRSRDKEYSKRLVTDIRWLLWLVTVGGIFLAALCIFKGYTGSLPWLASMVGLPWTAHGVVCSFYLSMAKSDHHEGGITYESAKSHGFEPEPEPEQGREKAPEQGSERKASYPI